MEVSNPLDPLTLGLLSLGLIPTLMLVLPQNPESRKKGMGARNREGLCPYIRL